MTSKRISTDFLEEEKPKVILKEIPRVRVEEEERECKGTDTEDGMPCTG